jgi:hypothetical protein
MIKVLFLNHQHVECGVYQIGRRIFNLACKSEKVLYYYRDVSSWTEYKLAVNETKPDYIIYNWHWDRMPWLRDIDITEQPNIKHYFIYHDGSMMNVYDKYLIFGAMPPSNVVFPEGKSILLPRPLYEYKGDYPINDVITVGSFGFAFNHKKFHTVAPYVGSQFENAIVNLHFTNPYFGDTPGNKLADIISLCFSTCPANVKLYITTNFMEDNKVLSFLAGNDINLFLYDVSLQNPGISSAIDYALSVRRPIAVSNNMMFRHIITKDILVERRTLKQILDNGTAPLERYYSEWSTNNFKEAMENLFL